jgi:transcriptional regulator with XRE-family HTH domain
MYSEHKCQCQQCRRKQRDITVKRMELSKFIAAKGLTLRSIAQEINISVPYLSQILNGKRPAPHVRKLLNSRFTIPLELLSDSSAHDSANSVHNTTPAEAAINV